MKTTWLNWLLVLAWVVSPVLRADDSIGAVSAEDHPVTEHSVLSGDPVGEAVVTGESVDGPVVEVPVTYDGPDLDEVARATGLSVAEVVDLHSSTPHRVAFCGFMPGFAYLVGLPSALHLARRTTPRPRVPAGSVAIAAGYSGVYPRESPGGWHLIGWTDVVLWDEEIGRAHV